MQLTAIVEKENEFKQLSGAIEAKRILIDAAALKMVRTEEGKVLRKQYESGEIHHGFNEYREAEPRQDGLSNTITTVQKDNLLLEKQRIIYDEQNQIIRTETVGTLTTDGNSPKHNNRVIECKQIKIRQATEQGYALCDIGGSRLGISNISNKARSSDRERQDMSNSDNGEYP